MSRGLIVSELYYKPNGYTRHRSFLHVLLVLFRCRGSYILLTKFWVTGCSQQVKAAL